MNIEHRTSNIEHRMKNKKTNTQVSEDSDTEHSTRPRRGFFTAVLILVTRISI